MYTHQIQSGGTEKWEFKQSYLYNFVGKLQEGLCIIRNNLYFLSIYASV